MKFESNKKNIILIIIVMIITVIICKIIYWAENNLYDIFNPTNYLVNDFTNINCNRQGDLVSCDIIVNKENLSIDYFSVNLEYTSNLQYTDSGDLSDISVTQRRINDDIEMYISKYESHNTYQNGKNILSINFNVNKEIDNSKIVFNDIYFLVHNETEDSYYEFEDDVVINISDLNDQVSQSNNFTNLNCYDTKDILSCELLVDKKDFFIDSITFEVETNVTLTDYVSYNSEEVIGHNIFKNSSSYEIKDVYIENNKDSIIVFNFFKKNIDSNFKFKIFNLCIRDHLGNTYFLNELLYNK